MTMKNVVSNPTDSFSNSNVALRILGGKEAKDAQFPYAAAVIAKNEQNETKLCGGSLITSTAVLTAGHCLHEKIEAAVILGARNLTEHAHEPKKQMFISANLIVHPHFDHTNQRNDLGIVKLSTLAILDKHVNIIHIPNNDEENYAGKAGTSMGWGYTSGTAEEANLHALLYESNTILTNAGCEKTNPHMKGLLDTHMCQSGKGGKGTCLGDSGGPLVVSKNLLVGVVSFAHPDCGYGYACGFTRLSKYIQWINDNSH